MAIRFVCPICKTAYTVNDRDAGKKADCKVCGQRLQVPAPARRKTVLGEELADDYPAAPPPADDPLPAEPPSRIETYYEPSREQYDEPPPRSGMSAGHLGVLIFSVAALLFAVGVVAVILIAKSNDQQQPAEKKQATRKPAAVEEHGRAEQERRDGYERSDDRSAAKALLGLVYIVVWLLVYFLPTWIALLRGHNNALAIFCFNLFLGWTCLGWVAALVWAVLNAPVMSFRAAPRDVA